jgi:hypothetical protein
MVRLVILAALAAHGVLTIISFRDHGYPGFFPPFADSNTTQVFSDLVVALSLVNIWVFFDLKRRGKPFYWFFIHLLATAMFGSFAPLVYLLTRGEQRSSSRTDLKPTCANTE